MYGGKWPDPMNFRRILEAVFQPELSQIFPMISDQFLPKSTGSSHESTGKNPDNFRPEYCFHFRGIFGVFLRDTATILHLFCRILRDSAAGIFDLRYSFREKSARMNE